MPENELMLAYKYQYFHHFSDGKITISIRLVDFCFISIKLSVFLHVYQNTTVFPLKYWSYYQYFYLSVGVFNMPNPNRWNILSLSIFFFKISISILIFSIKAKSISISLFFKMSSLILISISIFSLSISLSISIFLINIFLFQYSPKKVDISSIFEIMPIYRQSPSIFHYKSTKNL